MLIASLVLVFGVLAVFIGNVAASDGGRLFFGFEQMIHARVPWLLQLAAVAGAGLGIASLVRARRWYKWVLVPVEVLAASLVVFYFSWLSWLPAHELALAVGDEFPSYALVDQDGQLHAVESATDRNPALFVFYRGDW